MLHTLKKLAGQSGNWCIKIQLMIYFESDLEKVSVHLVQMEGSEKAFWRMCYLVT